mgnify:CR=1 FL=1
MFDRRSLMLGAGASLAAQDVIDWSREHMANFKVPRFVEFVDTYPMTASGKVLKTELRAREKNAGKAAQ